MLNPSRPVLHRAGHVLFPKLACHVSHGVELRGPEVFYAEVHLHGGPAPIRRFLPHLLDLVSSGQLKPRQGIQSGPTARVGGRRLSCDGREARDQNLVAPMTPVLNVPTALEVQP